MPKAFSEREKEIIIQNLFEQGRRLFSTYGLKKTNVEEIAQAAGISKGAFYLFYESKEALFMDVVERAEEAFRVEMLAELEKPGPNPRARLVAVFKKAFSLYKTIPVLQFFNSTDYEVLARRMPPEKLLEHVQSDRLFIQNLVDGCRQNGIPIKRPVERISGMMYVLFFTAMHENDFGPDGLRGTLDDMIELVAAFCLGEIDIPTPPTQQP